MNIATIANHPFISQHAKSTGNTTGQADASTSFAAILNTHTAPASPVDSSAPKRVNPVDFTSMTRQEMYDWMNSQIRSGKMSFDDSRPFLGMTFKDSNMATDTTRIDFIEKARQGIEWAMSRNDQVMAERLGRALETMQRNQL